MKELLKRYEEIFNEIMEFEKQLWSLPAYNFMKRNEIKGKIKQLFNLLYKKEGK